MQTQAVVPKQTHVAKERVTVTEMKNAKDTLSQRAQTVRYPFLDALASLAFKLSVIH